MIRAQTVNNPEESWNEKPGPPAQLSHSVNISAVRQGPRTKSGNLYSQNQPDMTSGVTASLRTLNR